MKKLNAYSALSLFMTGINRELRKLYLRWLHYAMHNFAICVGLVSQINDGQTVVLGCIFAQHDGKGKIFHWRLHGQLGRCVKCRIWFECTVHNCSLPLKLADGTVGQKLTQRTDGLAADCENELDKINQATTNH